MMEEAPFSNREIREMFSDSAKDLAEIKVQTKATNGRVTNLERWRYFSMGAVSILNNITGGGNMNRQILFGGTNSLTKYTDINYIAGSGIQLTVANNETYKRVDVTITATGSGSGITRSINSIAVDTTAAAASDIDYVYLVSGTTTLTLPTAVGNENLYTIKNVGGDPVTIATTGGQTIEGDSSIVLVIRYTSVDLISDGANWNVT